MAYGGGVILAGGLDGAGHSANGVFRLDPSSGQLDHLGSVPQAFHDAGGVILAGRLLVFGGGPETGTSTVQSFDLRSHTGRVISHLPKALSDLSAVLVGGTAYLVGGFDGLLPQRAIYATTDGVRFRRVGELPVGLRYPAVASSGNGVVIAGGMSRSGAVSSIYRFDPAAGRVRLIGRLPAPLAHAAAFSLAGKVYVTGGRDASGSVVGSVTVVDPVSRLVRSLAALPMPVADAGAATVGGSAWLIGGWNGAPVGDVVQVSLARARSLYTAARLNGRGKSTEASTATAPQTNNVYAATAAGDFSPAVQGIPERVYVPNSRSGTVDVIDPATFRVIRHFRVGLYDQHITPAWDLRHLYVNNTLSNSLTVIDPRTGAPTATIPVPDPYNLYFTPDGSSAIVVAESLQRLDLRDPHTWALQGSVTMTVAGPNHLDFSADGSYLLMSAEFSGDIVKVDLKTRQVVGQLNVGGSPVDVKLSPDGSVFFVANQILGGVSVIDPNTMHQLSFIHTGAGAHGFAYSRDTRFLYLSNRIAGTISVLDPNSRQLVKTWTVGGSPDMLQVSPDGRQLWFSNRYNRSVSVIDTRDGHLLHTFHLGDSPHGLAYFPQPGRYSLGHNGVYR